MSILGSSTFLIVLEVSVLTCLIYLYVRHDIKKRPVKETSKLNGICSNEIFATLLFPIYLLFRNPKLTESIEEEDVPFRPRSLGNPFPVSVFSLLSTGAGHFYLGQFKYFLVLVCSQLCVFLTFALIFQWVIADTATYILAWSITYIVLALLLILSSLKCSLLIKTSSAKKKYKYNNPFIVLFLSIGINISTISAIDYFFYPNHDYDWFPNF